MTRTCSKSWNHLVWCGRIAEWSMSGFVTTTWPAVRTADRMGAGVSPSYVEALTVRPGGARQLTELCDLVLAERLGGEQEQGPRRRILSDRLQDGQRVAERLARRRGRDDNDVPAIPDKLDRLRLVRVQLVHAARGEAVADPRIQPRRQGRERAARGGMTSWWTTPRAIDGSSSRPSSTASTVAGA